MKKFCRTDFLTEMHLCMLLLTYNLEQTMYLQSHSRKKNGKTYTYYFIAESYREDGKNKKKVLSYLGCLTPL
jgi:hypothetical protein